MAYVVSRRPRSACRSMEPAICSRSAASSASAATMPPMPARWATIPTASRPSSSPSRPTPSSICADPKNPTKVAYPSATKNLHHEMELVVAMKSGGTDIPVDKALDHVFGYGVGLDMTRRDLQNQAKDMGRPWDMGKGFDQSAPIGEIYPGVEDRPSGQGHHPARRQRQDPPEVGPQCADLERAGDDLLSLRPGGAGRRRPDLHRHARRRGRRGQGRHAGGLRRRLRHGDLHPRLARSVIVSEPAVTRQNALKLLRPESIALPADRRFPARCGTSARAARWCRG